MVSAHSRPYAIVAGDFVKTGGMDRCNYALADYLARRGNPVELVGHRAAPELLARAEVRFRRVPKPFDSYVLGEPFLDRLGRIALARARSRGAVTVVNGGNCVAPGLNWVHYVHAGYPLLPALTPRAARRWLVAARARRFERAALGRAELVVANSKATRRELVELVGVPPERVSVVYLAVDASVFRPASADEIARTRRELELGERPLLAFVGPLTDPRKGFDTLLDAVRLLAKDPSWDVTLLAIGAGASVLAPLLAEPALKARVKLLGFRRDVPRILAAADGLVAPARYEPYGLGVAEALACGLPTLVSARAGVAELYTPDLADFLLEEPESASELAGKLRRWRERLDEQRSRIEALSARVRGRGWDDMAADMVTLAEERLG
jgi:glycosyltransferase involved in cell wall biosynthesis